MQRTFVDEKFISDFSNWKKKKKKKNVCFRFCFLPPQRKRYPRTHKELHTHNTTQCLPSNSEKVVDKYLGCLYDCFYASYQSWIKLINVHTTSVLLTVFGEVWWSIKNYGAGDWRKDLKTNCVQLNCGNYSLRKVGNQCWQNMGWGWEELRFLTTSTSQSFRKLSLVCSLSLWGRGKFVFRPTHIFQFLQIAIAKSVFCCGFCHAE